MDDWTLYRQAKRGNEAAWRMLIARHGPRLLNLVAFTTGSPEAAQDAVQEVFLDLYKRPPKHQKGSLASYLSTAAWRLALKAKKRHARVVRLQVDEDHAGGIEDEQPSALDTVLKSERDVYVMRAINRLEDDLRDVVLLRFYGGLAYDAIAREVGVPLGTVKSRLFRAVRLCGEQLKQIGWLD